MSNKVIWGAVFVIALVTGFSLDYYTAYKPVEVTKEYQTYNVTTFADKDLQGAENVSEAQTIQQTIRGTQLQTTVSGEYLQYGASPQQARKEF